MHKLVHNYNFKAFDGDYQIKIIKTFCRTLKHDYYGYIVCPTSHVLILDGELEEIIERIQDFKKVKIMENRLIHNDKNCNIEIFMDTASRRDLYFYGWTRFNGHEIGRSGKTINECVSQITETIGKIGIK